MYGRACRELTVDLFQEPEKLLRAVAALAFADHFARRDLQRREQRGRSVADVIMTLTLGVARPQRQHRTSPIESLYLALFVNAHHHGVIGRVHVQPRQVPHLLHEERVRGKLEVFGAMRLHRLRKNT